MLVSFLALVVLLVAALYFVQHRLIYFPRPYPPEALAYGRDRAEALAYRTEEGAMTAWFVAPRAAASGGADAGGAPRPPAGDGLPERVWLVFNGNGTLALDWLDFVLDCPDPQSAFLLMDYPGYGGNEGVAWDHTILASTEAAFARLAERLGIEPDVLAPRCSFLGHSLGAATALQFAVRLGPAPGRRIVLLAPFTSLRAMAMRSVGWPICHLARDRYDNVARLVELEGRSPRPAVTVIHGTMDQVVSVRMGRSFRVRFPDWVEYVEVVDGDHGSLPWIAREHIWDAMGVR